ncbi:MAG TPA: hypothetical protein VNS58_19785 [Puia sp.]|nr:hypothetical protein [Puia sp.]
MKYPSVTLYANNTLSVCRNRKFNDKGRSLSLKLLLGQDDEDRQRDECDGQDDKVYSAWEMHATSD